MQLMIICWHGVIFGVVFDKSSVVLAVPLHGFLGVKHQRCT